MQMEFKEVTPAIRFAARNQELERLMKSPESAAQELHGSVNAFNTPRSSNSRSWLCFLLSFLGGVVITIVCYEMQKKYVAEPPF